MKKRLFSAVIFLFALTIVFASCAKPDVPLSKMAEASSIKVFTAFGTIGLEARAVYIDKDLSGYVEYSYSGADTENLLTKLKSRVEDLNKRAFQTDSSDYDDGYRIIYYDESLITTDLSGSMSIKIQFVNINYLKSEISIEPLSEYLQVEDYENNNFISVSGDTVSIVNYKDTEDKYILKMTGAVNHVPITLNGTKILCYNYGDDTNVFVNVEKQTILFSAGDYKVVYSVTKPPVVLIVAASVVSVGLLLAILIRFIILPRMRG